MFSEVFFAQRRATQGGGLLDKIEQLFDVAGFGKLLVEGDLVALKLNFGERGNTTNIRPEMIKRVVKKVRQAGGEPFLTDGNFPGGARQNASSHLQVAADHGYSIHTVDAPVIIANGLRGRDGFPVEIAGKHSERVRIASAIHDADALFVLNHFTGHRQTGFCGVLNNLGLGCSSRDAVALEEGKLDPSDFQERMVEAFYGAVKNKRQKVGFINFLLDITPDSDSWDWSDAPVVGDVGIIASRDPVALEQASVDFFNQQPLIPGTRLNGLPEGQDRLKELSGGIDWEVQLRYAEKMGLGTREYEILII